MKSEIIWLLIAYKNMADVDAFVDKLDRLRGPSTSFVFGICDNSAVHVPSRHEGRQDVFTVERSDNPGYLDGARAALQAIPQEVRDRAGWVALSNTDLTISSGDPSNVLSILPAGSPVVVAPSISEDDGVIEKNPHVLLPRSLTRHRLNRVMTCTPTMAMGYLLLSRGRHQLRLRRPVEAREVAAPGQQMYSPYGAMIFFNRAFMQRTGLPAGVPLLAEEFAIAESARLVQAPVVFEPGIRVAHDAHTTTGPKVSRSRAVMLTRAFAYIAREASRAPR